MIKLGFSSIALVLSAGLITFGCGGDEFTEDPTKGTGASGGGGATTGGDGGDAGDTSMGGGGGGVVGGSGGSGGSPCPDADGDGFMDSACGGADCDDGDDTAFPGNPEVCGDLIDNDCANGADDICGGIGTYVSELGDDNDAGTQQFPVRTIDQGIVNALIIGGGVDVFVDLGAYPEDVTLEEGVSILGGYDSQNGWSRDPANNDSVISAQTHSGVQAGDQITRVTVVDGFTISGLGGNTTQTHAVYISGGTPTITNNRVNGGLITSSDDSHAIRIDAPSNNAAGALIAGNVITLGTSNGDNVTGILFQTPNWPPPLPGALAEVRGNTITGGTGRNVNSIAVWTAGASTIIADNDITAGSATNGQSWGIAFGRPSGSFVIDGNRINVDQGSVGSCTNLPKQNWCGGIVSFSGSAIVTNNVSFGMDAERSTGAMSWEVEGPIGQMLVNGNLLDGGGLQSADPNSESAALVLKTSQGIDSIVGRVRNNILMGGSNSNRFGVVEDDDVNNAARHARPEFFTNNDFFFAAQAGAVDVLYREYDGAVFTDITSIAGVNALAGIGAAANLGQDPKLTLGFHIDTTSPCVDAGTLAEAPATDFEGDGRPMGAAIDIGPDEAN